MKFFRVWGLMLIGIIFFLTSGFAIAQSNGITTFADTRRWGSLVAYSFEDGQFSEEAASFVMKNLGDVHTPLILPRTR